MLGEPARHRRRRDRVSVARGNFSRGLFERCTAVVCRERVEDLGNWVRFVAHGARTRGERAPARAAAVERNVLEFFPARALLDEALAVAVRAALGRFY